MQLLTLYEEGSQNVECNIEWVLNCKEASTRKNILYNG